MKLIDKLLNRIVDRVLDRLDELDDPPSVPIDHYHYGTDVAGLSAAGLMGFSAP